MEVSEDEIIINNGVTVEWAAVKTLKVLNNKLFFVLEGDIALEITGLPSESVDQIFVAYSQFLRAR